MQQAKREAPKDVNCLAFLSLISLAFPFILRVIPLQDCVFAIKILIG
jgi:hypothetical protein